ncbi:MAG: L,D-transpeptidase [Pseudomonadota bacterium]|nr:L,D-transpeptidase [Pseudomonadota bacterium]
MRRLIFGLACSGLLAAALWLVACSSDEQVLAPAALARAVLGGTDAAPASVGGPLAGAAARAPLAGLPSVDDEPAPANPLESSVARAWQLARRGRGTEADALLEAVLGQAPQYRPALTLSGLLHAEWSQPVADAEDERPPARQLQPPAVLSDESSVRLAAWQHQALHRRLLPGNLLQLGRQVDTVLAADLAESRLYVLRRDGHGLSLRADYYLSTGTRGSFKQIPGDQRTPIGVYSLLSRLPASQLPPLAGHGAWPLSFPNRWDQWQGHLGSGIWLHGSPPGQYDGLPHSTNGCLALSNDDLDQLSPLLAGAGTVLLVADHLDWITPAALAQRRSSAIQRLLAHGGHARKPAEADSLYAYPGDPSLLLVRRAEGAVGARDEFWPSGAMEPLAALHGGGGGHRGSAP